MLSNLFIKNYVLIEEISIEFPLGLLSITGETGAGKSIILGALKLVLGERADYKVFSNEKEKCIIEATFILNDTFKEFFNEKELEYEKETLLRREISPQGKTRAFINDIPVTLDILQQLSSKLIDIHSQFDTTSLLNPNYQLQLIDSFAKLQPQIKDYRKEYHQYKSFQYNLEQDKNSLSQIIKEKEYHNFLLEELQSISLESFNLLQLEEELKTQEHAEELIKVYAECFQNLSNEEYGAGKIVKDTLTKINKFTEISHSTQLISERLNSVNIELIDISKDIEATLNSLEIDPEKLEENKKIIDKIHSLFLKHHVNTIADLLQIKTDLENQTHHYLELKEKIIFTEKELQKLENQLKITAQLIHKKRAKNIPLLKDKIIILLSKLGLDKAKIDIRLTLNETLNENGKDSIQILFSANIGINLQPIAKAISGGERSRVMLALKKIIAENEDLPTLIFDEIDAGVSGRIANEMGLVMKEMAQTTQLIVITHLPQIAAQGNTHFKVTKKDINNITYTSLQKLNKEERVLEIAQLLSGSALTEAAINQAKELMI